MHPLVRESVCATSVDKFSRFRREVNGISSQPGRPVRRRRDGARAIKNKTPRRKKPPATQKNHTHLQRVFFFVVVRGAFFRKPNI